MAGRIARVKPGLSRNGLTWLASMPDALRDRIGRSWISCGFGWAQNSSDHLLTTFLNNPMAIAALDAPAEMSPATRELLSAGRPAWRHWKLGRSGNAGSFLRTTRTLHHRRFSCS